MLTLIHHGGIPMWFILVFGLVALAAAARYAIFPNAARSRPAFIQAMSATTLWATLACLAADLGMTGWRLTHTEEWRNDPNWHFILITGFAESMSPLVMGFALLALTALLVAVGRSREATPVGDRA